jgi:hypothetical protein
MRGCDLQRRFVSHGGLTAPALVLRCERLPAKNDFCDGLTLIRKSGGRQPAVGVGNAFATPIPLTSGDTRHLRRQERRASARRGWRKRTCNGASTKLRQTADGACAVRRCSRVQRRREGPTVVPTPAFRDFQSLCSRAGLPRGADAPRSWLYMRLCIAKVAISPARVRALKQERRASARRGLEYRTCKGASAKSRETACAMLTNAGAVALANHGG